MGEKRVVEYEKTGFISEFVLGNAADEVVI